MAFFESVGTLSKERFRVAFTADRQEKERSAAHSSTGDASGDSPPRWLAQPRFIFQIRPPTSVSSPATYAAVLTFTATPALAQSPTR
jgi:hypothetical protein